MALLFENVTAGGGGSFASRGAGDAPGTLVSVATDVTIDQIEVDNELAASGNVKFLIFSHPTHTLLYQSAPKAFGAGRSWKTSDPFSFTLQAGQSYDIGAISDVSGLWYFDGIGATQNGITSLSQNANWSNFATPAPAGHGAADVNLRLYGSLATGTLTPGLSGGDLTITDSDGTKSNNLTIVTSGASYVITDATEQFAGTGGISGAALSNGNKTLTVPIASITGSQVIINGAGGNDSLLQDLTGGAITKSIVFNGGLGDDALGVRGNGTQTVTYTPSATTNGDGAVVVNGVTHSFTGLEPVDFDNVGTFNLNLPGANDLVTLTNGFNSAITGALEAVGTVPATVFTGSSGGVGFEAAHVFRTTNVNVNTTGVAGVDTITIASASNAHANTNLSITTGAEVGDVINVNGGVSVTGAVSLSSVNINSTAAGTIATGTGLTLDNTGTASTLAGVISGGDTATLVKSGTGTISLTGANTYGGSTTVNASSGTLIATVNTAQNSLSTGAVSIGAGSTVQLNNTNTSATTVTIGNAFTGTGLLRLSFAAGGTARNTSMQNVTGFNGTIQLSNAGANADKWNVVGVNAPSASVVIDSGSQLFPNTSPSTFAAISAIGTGNSENRGAIRLASSLTAPLTLAGNATIGPEGGILNGTITTGVAGTTTLTVGTSNSFTFPNNMLNGVISNGVGTLALNVFNQNTGGVFISGASANTYSGGTTLLNSSSGTRLVIGGVTGTPYGTGPITIGAVATDRAGIYFTSANQTLANPIVFNTALGTDRAGVRSDVTGIVLNGAITANNAAATFSTNGTGAIRLNGQVTGAQGLTLDNTFGTTITVTLANGAGTNNYAGDTNIAGTKGVLVLAAANQIPNGAGTGNLVNNGTFNMGGFSEQINGLSGTGIVDGISGTPTLTLGDNNATGNTFSGVIRNTAGTLALTKIGTGTQTLSGANTYTGATTVSAGTLAAGVVSVAGVSGAFGNNSAVTMANVAGATLDITGFNTQIGSLTGGGAIGGNVTLGAATLTVGNANSTTYAGAISGSGALVKIGTGTLTLSGTSAYGNTTISQGTIVAASNSALGTTGTVTINDAATAANNTALLIDSAAGTVNINRPISVTNNGTGTTTLGTSASAGSNQSTFSGAITLAKAVTLQGAPAAGDRTQFTGGIGGTGDVTIGVNPQRVIFVSAANTYTGNTTVNAGSTLQLSDGSVTATSFIPDASLLTVNGTLNIAKGTNSEQVSALAGTGTVQSHPAVGGVTSTLIVSGGTASFSGTLANGGAAGATLALTKAGAGTQTLSGANIRHTGATLVSAGTLRLTSTTAYASATTVDAGATLALNGANTTLPAGGAITLNGGTLLTDENSGYYVLNGVVTVAADSFINTQGTGTTGFNSLLYIDGGMNSVGARTLTLTPSTVNNGMVLRNTSGTFNGSLVVNGVGAAPVSRGAIQVNNGATAGFMTNTDVTLNNATWNIGLDSNNDANTSGNVFQVRSLSGNGFVVSDNRANTLNVGVNNGSGSFSGSISNGTGGTLSLTKSGTGTQTLSGASIIYTGSTTVSGGTLQLTNTTALNTSIANNATVEINAAAAGDSWLLLAGRTLSGSGVWNKTGPGRATVRSGTFTTSGQYNITAGTFRNDFNAANWSGNTADMDISGGAILDLYADAIFVDQLTGTGFVQNGYGNPSGQSGASAFIERLVVGVNGGTSTFAGVIRNNATNTAPASAGAGGGVQLEKVGAGTTTLTGTNNYSGVTLVTAGTLLVNGTHTGAGAVTASNSAVLGGTGSLAAAVTMNNTSRLSPGTSPEDIATGNLTLTSGSFFDVEIGGTAPGNGVSGYDQVDVTGAISLGNAVLNLQQILGFTVNSGVAQAYTIITNDGSDAVTGIFRDPSLNPLPEGAPIAYAGGTLYVSYAGNDGNDVVLYSQPTVNGSAGADALVLRQVSGNPALVEFSLNNASFVQVTSALPFLYNGNLGTDLLLVDTSNGDPISTGNTTFNGELLRVQKNTGVASDIVTYVPTTTAGTGAVNHATFGTINFTQTTNVDFVNLTTVNIQSATANDTLTIADGNTATNGAAVPAGYSIAAAADLSVGGANAVVGLRNVTNSNVDTVAGGGNGNDSVTINSGTGAHGNTNLTITTSTGTDTVTVAGALTVAGNIDIGSQSIAVNATLTGGATSTATLNAGAGAITTSGIGVDIATQDLVATATTGINLDTTVLNVTATNSGAGVINLDETNGANLLNVAAANGASTVTTATGNLHVTTVSASTTVTLTATTGAITDANAGTNNITGAALVLTAASGVGSLADSLESTVANLEASGGTGGVFVANAGALTIGGIGVMTGIDATGGDVVVTTTGAITIAEDVTATGALTDVTLTAIDAAAAGQNLVVSGGATVSSAAASVTLNAGDNATITGNVSSGGFTTINVDFGDAESAAPTATVGDGGTLSITGVVTTPNSAVGGAFLNGGNDYDTFSFNPQTTTAFYVDGDAPVGGTVGDILQMNVTGTVNPNLTVPGNATVFNGKTYNGPGSGVWTFDPNHREVRFKSLEDAQITGNYHLTYDNSVAPVGNLVVMLDGTANPNEKLQFRDSTTGGTVLYQTTLTPILSVRVLGGALNDVVTVDDINGLPSFGGDVPGSTGVGDNPFTSDTGPTAPPEFFFDAGGGTNVLNFNLNAASTQQQYAIGTGTGPGAGEGEVQSTNGATGLNTYFREVSEVNRTGVGGTPGGLTVFGDDLGNVISVAANGSETRVAATGYVPFDFSANNYSALVVNGQAGSDTVDLISFGTSQTNNPLITLSGNTDDDTIRVRSTTGNTNTVTLNGNAGSDLFQLFDAANTVDFIAGPVVVDGTDGNVANNTDTLTIVDSGDGSGDTVLVSAVNAGASDQYAVEGINNVGVNDVVFHNIDVLDYTGTSAVDTIDGQFVNTTPAHDLSTVSLSGWLGADQFLLFISDQIGGSGPSNTPSGIASEVASVSLFGDAPGNPNPGDGNDIFGVTHPDIMAQGAMNVGLVVPDTFRLIRPSATTAIAIDGGQPSGLAAPLGDVAGDVHNLDISALPNTTPVVVSTFGPGTVVAAGIAPITWTQIEDINLVDQGKLTNVQMGDLFARTTPNADLIQITRNPTALNPHQVRLRLTATIGNYSASNKTIMYAGGMNDTLTQANLTIPAEFYGEAGDDYLTGATNNDWLVGGIGNDRINGGAGDNVIWGDNAPTNPGDLVPQDGSVGGDDQLSGLGGSDVFYGGAGNDLVSAGGGNDYAYGGEGNDTLDGHDGDDRLYGGVGNDIISGFAGNDLLVGNADADRIYGGEGNDVLFGGSGADLIDGGIGNDLLVSGSVGIETSIWTSLANTSTYSPATYSLASDNDAALITLLANWAAFSDRGTLGTVPSISHDGQNDDLFGNAGDDDFCWELADVLDNPPGISPPDYNALGQGSDERFGPT